MKKVLLCLILAILPVILLLAQAPQAFKYQAIARDEAGNILSNWDISLRISIISVGQEGQEAYVETQRITSNIYGLINLVIGDGDVIKGNFKDISWGENRHYIKLEMDIEGGDNYQEMGTSQLYAVPYALYAEQAGNLVVQKTQQNTATQNSPKIKVTPSTGSRNGTPNSKFPADANSHMNVNIGYVGIGTTDPLEKLDVNGNIKANRMILTDPNGNQWEIFIDTTGVMYLVYRFIVCGDSLYDYRDGQYYQTMLIGTQCWMAENLNVGTKINSTTGGQQQMNNDTIEKYCYNNEGDSCNVYGGLYEWNEAMQYVTTDGAQGICPDGWHMPTDGQWTTLTTYLGGESIAGGKMKSTGTIEAGTGLWTHPNEGATNESGFTGLPGGQRDIDPGSFSLLGHIGCFWSSSDNGSGRKWSRLLNYGNTDVLRFHGPKAFGYSVRCLKDD